MDFITFICCIAGPLSYHTDVGWSTFVSITAFIVTLALLMMYFAHLIEMLQGIPWLLVVSFYFFIILRILISYFFQECLYCGIWVLFFLIAACLMAAKSTSCGACQAYGAASVSTDFLLFFFFLKTFLIILSLFQFFGFMAMVAYGFDCFLKFNAWRNGDVAQGTPPTIAMRGGSVGY